MSHELCVVFICNKYYFGRFLETFQKLVTVGQYQGPIVCIIGNDLRHDKCLRNPIVQKYKNVEFLYRPDIQFSQHFQQYQWNLSRPPHWREKMFQYNKFHIFDTYFKKFKYVCYFDCGLTIDFAIAPILEKRHVDCFLANRDGIDNNVGPNVGLQIHNEFIRDSIYWPQMVAEFGEKLNRTAFQTTVLLFDTTHIHDDTKHILIQLAEQWPNAYTNDQAIICLFFALLHPIWRQLRRSNDTHYLYDYIRCDTSKPYIMYKNVSFDHITNGYPESFEITYN